MIRSYTNDQLLEVFAVCHVEGLTTARALERMLGREPQFEEWSAFNAQVERLHQGWVTRRRNVRDFFGKHAGGARTAP